MRSNKLGCIHIYTGEGKGKTTSAMGLAIRAQGRGLKVKIVQFFKRNTGEKKIFDQLGISFKQFAPLHPYFKQYDTLGFEELKTDFQDFLQEETEDLFKGQYDLFIMDEIGPAISWKLCADALVLELMKTKSEHTELILTGRGFPDSVKDQADYVTEMSLVKHPYLKGVLAREGIEY